MSKKITFVSKREVIYFLMYMFLFECNKNVHCKMPFVSQSFAVRAKNEILTLYASVSFGSFLALVKHEGVTS